MAALCWSRARSSLALVAERAAMTGCRDGGLASVVTRAFASLATWGNGDLGRLGHGDECTNVEVPVVCSTLSAEGIRVKQVSCGGAHTLVLDDAGRVYSMGLNDEGQLGQGTDEEFVAHPQRVQGIEGRVKAIAAGRDNSVCVSEDGRIWVSGSNKKGKLGLGKRSPSRLSSFQVNQYLEGYHIDKVAVGAMHTLSLSNNGEVFSWGSSSYGVLGQGMTKRFVFVFAKDEWTPRKLSCEALDDVQIKSIAAGDTYSGCIDDQGRVFTWGQGSFWKLGLDRDVDQFEPKRIEGLSYVKKIALGFSHSLALTHSGAVYVWGANQHGCLGLGRKGASTMKHPERLVMGGEEEEEEDAIADICCGWKHSAAVTRGGRVLTWGWGGSMGTSSIYDSGGQLGHGNNFDYWAPTRSIAPRDAQGKALLADSVSCGFNHTAAVYSPQP